MVGSTGKFMLLVFHVIEVKCLLRLDSSEAIYTQYGAGAGAATG